MVLSTAKRILGAFPILLMLAGCSQQQTQQQNQPQAAANASPAGPISSWVQLGENGKRIARQVFSGNQTCPAPFALRSGPIANFPITVCERELPSAESANVSVAILGDTGCKGNAAGSSSVPTEVEDDELNPPAPGDKSDDTDCLQSANWPFGPITASIAARAPGLVIHVGDYVYVKEESWNSWNSQFFTPAKPLLSSNIPWIFVRGNHETCDRHGIGYFLLLDPRNYPVKDQTTTCSGSNLPSYADATPSYRVPFGSTEYVVLDSSGATCDFAGQACAASSVPPANQVATWTELIKASNKTASKQAAVLLTHRPFFGAKEEKFAAAASTCQQDQADVKGRGMLALNSVLQTAWTGAKHEHLTLLIAGHTHTWAMLTYSDRPTQIVTGNGGVKLTHHLPKFASNCNIATTASNGAPYIAVASVNGVNAWGYTWFKDPASPSFSVITWPDDKKKLDCTIGSGCRGGKHD